MEALAALLQPRTGTPQEWNEAYSRLVDYLRAHRISERLRVGVLAVRILNKAAKAHEDEPNEKPVTITMREAQRMIDLWFAGTIDAPEGLPQNRLGSLGRVAFLLSDGPRSKAALFLEDEVPSDFRAALRTWSVRAGPNLEVSSMVPRSIDLGLVPEVADETWTTLENRPVIRMLLLWAIFLSALLGVVLLYL